MKIKTVTVTNFRSLRSVILEAASFNDFAGYLAIQFPDCTKVAFRIVEPSIEEVLKNYDTRVDDGVETNAEEKGDGMQRALMLAIIKMHADFRREDALVRPKLELISCI